MTMTRPTKVSRDHYSSRPSWPQAAWLMQQEATTTSIFSSESSSLETIHEQPRDFTYVTAANTTNGLEPSPQLLAINMTRNNRNGPLLPVSVPSAAASNTQFFHGIDLRDLEPRPIGHNGLSFVDNSSISSQPASSIGFDFAGNRAHMDLLRASDSYSGVLFDNEGQDGPHLSPNQSENINDDGKSLSTKSDYSSANSTLTTNHPNRNPTRKWGAQLDDLRIFKARHGHCDVLREEGDELYATLAQWVKRQRYHYKLRQVGKSSPLTTDQIKLLDELEFIWDSHDCLWKTRFAELEEYCSVHQHCNVPRTYPKNQPLATWVKRQRRQYNKGELTQDRTRKLENIGFLFQARRGERNRG